MKFTITTLIFSCLLLTACSKGFQSAGSGSGSSANGSQGSGGDSSNGSTPTWDKVDANGYPSGGTNAGQLVFYVDKVNQSFLMVLPIPALIPILSPVQIPDVPGAYLTSYTDSQGNISLAVNIPLKYIIKGGVFSPNERLPNGDPLPFVPAGELPGFGIQFPQMPNYRIHLYIGVNVAAVFVELPDLGLPVGATFPVKNAAKTKIVGAIGYVPVKANHPGGVYLAGQIPDEVAALIDDLIRW